MARKSQQQIRDEVTQTFVKAIKEDTPPWRQSWSKNGNTGLPRNFHSKRRYTGINPLLLMWTAMSESHTSSNWGTYNCWMKHLGVQVQKGEKSAHVVLFKFLDRRDKTGAAITDSKGNTLKFPMMTQFPVFNADQVKAPDVSALLDGKCRAGKWGSVVRSLLTPDSKEARTKQTTVAELEELVTKYVPKNMVPDKKLTRQDMAQLVHDGIKAKLAKYQAIIIERNDEPDFDPAEQLIAATEANVRHGGDRAFYRPSEDRIQLPPKRTFDSMSNYYETAFHELVHWTEKKERVGRKEGHKYAFGELVAEIGACFLMMELGVPLSPEMSDHSKSYVKSWLQGMTNEDDGSKFIFDAATQAGKAVDYLLTFVGKENPAYEEEQSRKVA